MNIVNLALSFGGLYLARTKEVEMLVVGLKTPTFISH